MSWLAHIAREFSFSSLLPSSIKVTCLPLPKTPTRLHLTPPGPSGVVLYGSAVSDPLSASNREEYAVSCSDVNIYSRDVISSSSRFTPEKASVPRSSMLFIARGLLSTSEANPQFGFLSRARASEPRVLFKTFICKPVQPLAIFMHPGNGALELPCAAIDYFLGIPINVIQYLK